LLLLNNNITGSRSISNTIIHHILDMVLLSQMDGIAGGNASTQVGIV
jgi:hypothetical protein